MVNTDVLGSPPKSVLLCKSSDARV